MLVAPLNNNEKCHKPTMAVINQFCNYSAFVGVRELRQRDIIYPALKKVFYLTMI